MNCLIVKQLSANRNARHYKAWFCLVDLNKKRLAQFWRLPDSGMKFREKDLIRRYGIAFRKKSNLFCYGFKSYFLFQDKCKRYHCMIVVRRAFVLLVVPGIVVIPNTQMLTNKINKTQSMMFFVVMVVVGNEFGNKRKGMCCFAWQGNHQNQKEYNRFLQTFHWDKCSEKKRHAF